MRLGRMKISQELLAAALGFPKDATLVRVQDTDEYGIFEMIVSHESFPEIEEGDRVPGYRATIHSNLKDCGHTEASWSWDPLDWANDSPVVSRIMPQDE